MTAPAGLQQDKSTPQPIDGQDDAKTASKSMPVPAEAQPISVYWLYATGLAVIHGLALLAFWPWLFTWSGVALVVFGHFFFGMIGINICYHRLLTHQGFTCPKWLEYSMALLGVCCFQESPAHWVAIHRMHHQHSDHQPDPHSPYVSFIWSHVGWLVVRNRNHDKFSSYERYVRDLLRQPFYFRLEKNYVWFYLYLLHAVLFYVVGAAVGYFWYGTGIEALRVGLSWLVWGVFVRTVVVLHITWLVNSITHVWGYRNYETRDNSRNSMVIAMMTHGEGWHNNHHADQRAVNHGHNWWELDYSHWVICGMEAVGLAKNVVRAKREIVDK